MPSGTKRPNVIIGPTSPDPDVFVYPLSSLGLVFQSHEVARRRRVQPRPLFQRSAQYADTNTPATQIDIAIRASVNEEFQHDVDVLCRSLWNAFGEDEFLMHLTNDDQADVVTTVNAETAGSNVVVEINEAPPDWLTTGALVFYNGPGTKDEIVVVEATSPAPKSFTADLTVDHAETGLEVFPISISYQGCVLRDIQQSAVPMGKGSLVIQISCLNGDVIGGSLPS